LIKKELGMGGRDPGTYLPRVEKHTRNGPNEGGKERGGQKGGGGPLPKGERGKILKKRTEKKRF